MNGIKRFFKLYSLPMYIMVRPFAGFYAMKFEEKGTVKLALFNFLLMCIVFAFSTQYTALLVNDTHPLVMNSLRDAFILGGMLLLFCAANWSASSISRGEGRFKDIVMAICYAMTPLIIIITVATILSNFITSDEAGLYYLLMSVGMFYFVLLCFIGLLTVHNYGAAKAAVMIFMTFVAMLVIVFLGALFFSLYTQLYGFLYSLYTEITFRFDFTFLF